MISVRSDGSPSIAQKQLLEGEGIEFKPSGEIDLDKFGWTDPGEDNGFE